MGRRVGCNGMRWKWKKREKVSKCVAWVAERSRDESCDWLEKFERQNRSANEQEKENYVYVCAGGGFKGILSVRKCGVVWVPRQQQFAYKV